MLQICEFFVQGYLYLVEMKLMNAYAHSDIYPNMWHLWNDGNITFIKSMSHDMKIYPNVM